MAATSEPARFRDAHARLSKNFWACILILVIGLALALGGLHLASSMQEWAFAKPHTIQVGTNPNHFFRVEMQSVNLIAWGQDYIVRPEMRVANSGAVPVNLDGHTVRLVDSKGNEYTPTFPPEAAASLSLVPQKSGVLTMDFSVPAGAMDGELQLAFGANNRFRIKNEGALKSKLRDHEGRVLKKLTW